jgi:hypothetical protein
MAQGGVRQRQDRASLTERGLLLVLRRTLSRRNGFIPPDCASLLIEARRFGVATPVRLRKLLLKHRRALVADDRSALRDKLYMATIEEDRGREYVLELRRKQRCFTWEAQMRTAFEMEFGEVYEEFARSRDGL